MRPARDILDRLKPKEVEVSQNTKWAREALAKFENRKEDRVIAADLFLIVGPLIDAVEALEKDQSSPVEVSPPSR